MALQFTQRNLNLVLVIVLFPGFIFDSIKMEVGISDEKAKATIEIIQEFLEQDVVTIRQLATVVGTLVALDPGNCIGSVFLAQA